MNNSLALGRDQLVNRCDPAALGFETTAELEDLPDPFGQQRAINALDFALGVAGAGYNVYVMGPPGSGRHRTTERVLRSAAARQPSPSDWCYVHNFNEAHKPKCISLPAGEGRSFRRDMHTPASDTRYRALRRLHPDEVAELLWTERASAVILSRSDPALGRAFIERLVEIAPCTVLLLGSPD